ncbi:DUF2058 domain-containing protein [Methylobacter sp. BlB1]|uniref:DUF2058 domain-containing protein n=1 Tax=Methylobacter sp. BlB1 TaxID=2785914 RepID=UPI001894A55F|nr:DUF2058 domain-containing protein [Methylobacter sp. BlB1]MBF6650557.1 DUF2058 domain-containing protein [Methylobacter sp. BlB1]
MSQRKLSLQEQLLKSGLTTDAKARQIRSEKRKQQRQNNAGGEDEAKRLAQKTREEQAARDRELSLLKKEQAEQKEISAQIKQLIDQNRKDQADDDGIAYKFSDNNKIKTVYVSEAMREQISKGRLAIVKWERQYEIVPADVALKIKARDANCVLVLNDQAEEKIDDAYAAYQIPDDLIW